MIVYNGCAIACFSVDRGFDVIMRTASLQFVCVWFSVAVATVTGADLTSYRFNTTLYNDENGGRYELYWNFNSEAGTIYFAVRVHTTGWVGFGLSPSGQMPGSDVVIGWVDDNTGRVHFEVRNLKGGGGGTGNID